ncbi:GDP-L-fucose synthase family protein [Zobellia laminariae]|uniref:GDP-L-fucose synthase family protein n=1 Tax=Zobellia laminariae TaxID=248906 RepID=UPI0026F44008|nr:GDP-L-fucose synthase [Zobellia laminariae]WKX75155.1 GDP-L-fucose synthase [Zobellia laminariae]
MNKDAKIYIAGHRGLVGSAILKKLKAEGFSNFVLKTHAELDLIDANAVASFFAEEKPEYVFLAAAKVGGIVANNTYRADFIYANLMIQNNIVHQSYVNNVKKLLFLGSTCIYPKECPQPMKEDYLLTDTLEYTNEPYAIAKIAGIKLCESYNLQYGTNFISVMPTNLYGPDDNFDLEKSHVLPALIRKMHLGRALEAQDWDNVRKDLNERPIEGVDGKSSESDIYAILEKYGVKKTGDKMSVEIWGSGKPMREFLWSEDMADACIFIMKSRDFKDTYNSSEKEIRNTHINIGTGKDLSIRELAESIKSMVGFEGSLNFNADKPDGTMKKLTDVSKLHGLGWKHSIDLKEGIEKMYSWYRSA